MIESKHDELALKKAWMEEAREMKLERLPSFLEKLANFDHDYGTICRAIAAAGVAASWALERTPKGGITGFQAGCVLWDLITGWDTSYEGKPVRIMNYEDLLYPQYEEKFKTISVDTWEHIREKAKALLAEKRAYEVSSKVTAHWQSIVDGNIPFGLGLRG